MDIARLAAKQKRVENWRALLSSTSITPDVADQISKNLDILTKKLASCVASGTLNDSDLKEIDDLERLLEDAHELSRLKSKPRLSGLKLGALPLKAI